MNEQERKIERIGELEAELKDIISKKGFYADKTENYRAETYQRYNQEYIGLTGRAYLLRNGK